MKKLWVAIIGALVLLGIAFLILGLVKPTPPSVPVRAGEFEDSIPKKRVQELISLAFPEGIKVAGAKVPFKVTHQSPEQTADFTFNALGSIWEIDLPKGDKVAFEVRFKEESGGWSDWQGIEEEDDLKEEPPPKTFYGRLLSTGDALQFQYRAVFTLGRVKPVPSVPKIKLTYIDSRGKEKAKGRSIGTVFRDAFLAVRNFLEFDGYEVSADSPSADIPVISRANWGADESYRFDKKGNEIWSRSYRTTKKMIVHHTVFSDPDPKAAVRAIYYYHAIVYGWSDIGYNFLIDRAGNIYEGRYGGDGVVAGHALRYNWGSIGVAVLGDFRYDKLNNQIRNALDKIAVWKFTRHGVDPTLKTYFIDRKLPSAFGHGVVLATACPGVNLENYVPTLRSHARFMPQKILVKFKSGVSGNQISNFARKLHLTEVSRHQNNVRRFRFSNKYVVGGMLSAISKEGIVSYARANYIRQATLTPNDPEFPNQWSLNKIKAPEAWDISPGGDSSVTVAVVDTGVAYESYSDVRGTYAKATDFTGTTFVSGYDFINNDAHANDDHGHGTAVASIIASTTNNSLGIAGIAYAAKIMPVKVLDQYGYGTDVTVADGIYWAANNGAKVLNLSLGGTVSTPILSEAVNYAIRRKRAIVVAAAGNQGREGLLYPARYTDVVAVGASDLNDSRTWYSNYGAGLDFLAPGGDLNADLDNNGTKDGILFETLDINTPKDFTQFEFALGQGTSFAAPHVSAVLALVISSSTGNVGTAEQIHAISKTVSNGVIDSASAVSNAPSETKPLGVLKNAGGDYNFFVYNTPSAVEPRGVIAADYWNIPAKNNIIAMDVFNVGGSRKIGVIKNDKGDYNFYLYDFPAAIQSVSLVGADYWNIPAGNRVVAIAGADVDGDGTDEVAVMKNVRGDYNLYVYKLPSGTEAAEQVGADYWNIPAGNNVVAMAGVGDINGDGKGDLGVMKDKNGDYNFFVYKAPLGTKAMSQIGADYWNIPVGNNVVDIAGVEDINGDGKPDLAVMKRVRKSLGWDYNLFVYPVPTKTEGVLAFGKDYWVIPVGNNTLFLSGSH